MKLIRNIYINDRLYLVFAVSAIFLVTGYFVDFLFFLGKIIFAFSIVLLAIDMYLLFFIKNQHILLTRELPVKLSNGDENTIHIYIKNQYLFPVQLQVIDETPYQFQLRNFKFSISLKPGAEKHLSYPLKPFERGEYVFGRTHAYTSTQLGLLQRRYSFGEKENKVPVYPSFLKMRKYELMAISDRLTEVGIKRIRRLGTHTEFDQIKEYVKGDNYRTINWKATAKRSRLMVNQYQQEHAQRIYSVVDMGRLMQMPFNGMSLLDFAINTTLVLSNVAVQKHDKAGLITFNKDIETFMPAQKNRGTIARLLEILYKQDTQYLESDYATLGTFIRRKIPHRSLMVVFTNFQTPASVENQLAHLKKIARNHLLLVVLFENTELNQVLKSETRKLEDLYVKTIAEKYAYDKKLIVHELKRHGILSILTQPENLSVAIINKYIEIKQVGLL